MENHMYGWVTIESVDRKSADDVLVTLGYKRHGSLRYKLHVGYNTRTQELAVGIPRELRYELTSHITEIGNFAADYVDNLIQGI